MTFPRSAYLSDGPVAYGASPIPSAHPCHVHVAHTQQRLLVAGKSEAGGNRLDLRLCLYAERQRGGTGQTRKFESSCAASWCRYFRRDRDRMECPVLDYRLQIRHDSDAIRRGRGVRVEGWVRQQIAELGRRVARLPGRDAHSQQQQRAADNQRACSGSAAKRRGIRVRVLADSAVAARVDLLAPGVALDA
jgi:hypothetical protein